MPAIPDKPPQSFVITIQQSGEIIHQSPVLIEKHGDLAEAIKDAVNEVVFGKHRKNRDRPLAGLRIAVDEA